MLALATTPPTQVAPRFQRVSEAGANQAVLSLDPDSAGAFPRSCIVARTVSNLRSAESRLLRPDVLFDVAAKELELYGPARQELAADRRLRGRMRHRFDPAHMANRLLGGERPPTVRPLLAAVTALSAATLTPISAHALPRPGVLVAVDPRDPGGAAALRALALQADDVLLLSSGLDATQRLAATEAMLRLGEHLTDAGARLGPLTLVDSWTPARPLGSASHHDSHRN